MNPSEPIGNPLFAPFLVRVGLGSYFILAGLAKLDQIRTFVDSVLSFNILPRSLALVYGHLLPYLEVTVGTLLVLGFWTTAAALSSSFLLLSFIFAIGLFPNSKSLFNKDLILLGASMSLLYSGAGAISIDRFRKA
jgi:thiosulfate dehydrogenase [quinone] large subunit